MSKPVRFVFSNLEKGNMAITVAVCPVQQVFSPFPQNALQQSMVLKCAFTGREGKQQEYESHICKCRWAFVPSMAWTQGKIAFFLLPLPSVSSNVDTPNCCENVPFIVFSKKPTQREICPKKKNQKKKEIPQKMSTFKMLSPDKFPFL